MKKSKMQTILKILVVAFLVILMVSLTTNVFADKLDPSGLTASYGNDTTLQTKARENNGYD